MCEKTIRQKAIREKSHDVIQESSEATEGEYKLFGQIVRDMGNDQMALEGATNWVKSALTLMQNGKTVPGTTKPWIKIGAMSKVPEIWHYKEKAESKYTDRWTMSTKWQAGNASTSATIPAPALLRYPHPYRSKS